MRLATFYDSQFVSADSENQAFSQVRQSLSDLVTSILTPGVLGLTSSAFSSSGLTLTANLSSTRLIFSTGIVGLPLGAVDGSTSASYSLSLSGYVPASGTQTVYLVATPVSIGANPAIISGPPPGNPDYDPTFTPYTGYLVYLDSFSVSASTTAPVAPALELGRFTLSQGTTTLPTIDITHVSYAGVADVTDWTSAQIVNAESITSLLTAYLTEAASDKRYQPLGTYTEPSDWTTVSGQTGYRICPDGEIEMWGLTAVPATGTTFAQINFTFPFAFPKQCYGVNGNSMGIAQLATSGSAGGGWPSVSADSVTQTGARLTAECFGQYRFTEIVYIFWRARGR